MMGVEGEAEVEAEVVEDRHTLGAPRNSIGKGLLVEKCVMSTFAAVGMRTCRHKVGIEVVEAVDSHRLGIVRVRMVQQIFDQGLLILAPKATFRVLLVEGTFLLVAAAAQVETIDQETGRIGEMIGVLLVATSDITMAIDDDENLVSRIELPAHTTVRARAKHIAHNLSTINTIQDIIPSLSIVIFKDPRFTATNA